MNFSPFKVRWHVPQFYIIFFQEFVIDLLLLWKTFLLRLPYQKHGMEEGKLMWDFEKVNTCRPFTRNVLVGLYNDCTLTCQSMIFIQDGRRKKINQCLSWIKSYLTITIFVTNEPLYAVFILCKPEIVINSAIFT